MGTSSSTPQQTPEQLDLAFLGERFPYGDEELRHLYEAYQSLLSKHPHNGPSFFQEWFVACAPPEKNAQQHQQHQQRQSSRLLKPSSLTLQDRQVIMEMMEEHILGSRDLGNTLFQVACLLPGEPNWYHNAETNNQQNTSPDTETDEFTRRAKLEQFMEGFSNMGRRGAKQALTVLFNAVHAREQQSQQPKQNNPSTSTTNSTEKTISAHLFMEWGYRLALANAFLERVHLLDVEQQQRQQRAKPDQPAVATNPLPPTSETENNTSLITVEESEEMELIARVSGLLKEFIPHLQHMDRDLKPMAQSLLEKTKSRLNRYGILTANKEWDDQDPTAVELTDCLEWSEAVAPLFATILPTCLFQILFFGRPVPPTRTFFQFPNHQLQENTTTDTKGEEEVPVESILDSKPKAFALACASSSLMGPYFRLYTSAADGLSFNRILNALLGYSGPTLLLVQSTNGGEFGAFTSQAWKESKDFYGNSDCFLFQLHPQLSVFRPTGNGRNFMYCNSHARSKGYDQQAHGIGFGGTTDQPRLFLAENLMEDCHASTQDMTFENGSLLPKLNQQSSSGTSTYSRKASSSTKAYFDIHSLEIWGVGGSDIVQAALDGRRKARELRDEGIRRARKVDKAQFLDDFRSGAIESKAFAYKQQIDGRADQDVDDRNNKGYSYEK